jgi:hypothetical protein
MDINNIESSATYVRFFYGRIHLINGGVHGGHQMTADIAHPDTCLMGTGTLTRWYEHTGPGIPGI